MIISKVKKLKPRDRLQIRFEKYFTKASPEDCWLWKYAYDKDGYGQIGVGSSNLSGRSHRRAYQLYVGEIPPGIYVLHTCDNRPCVNPHHLFLGTQKDNIQDMITKGRRVQSNTVGEHNGRARLTEEKVRLIRRLSSEGYRTCDLARKFGMSWTATSEVISRESWSHVN
jgi:HNH endonuclease